MKKLLSTIVAMCSACVMAAGITVEGEYYEHTKRTAPSSLPYIQHSNVVEVATSVANKMGQEIYGFIGPLVNTNVEYSATDIRGNVAIGAGANAAFGPYGNPLGIVAINPYWNYPSFAYGSFNTVIGIDSIVGYGDDGVGGVLKSGTLVPNAATYSVAIGVSNRAQYQHDYVFGSQANAFAANSTVIGYGASSTDTYSVVIGHGKRPTSDGIKQVEKKFSSDEEWQAWLRTANNANIRRGVTFANTNSNPRVYYVITKVLTTPDVNGYYANILEVPEESLDIVAGKYDWRYGKSHGRGTFNIVAYNGGTVSPGLSAVYINDDNLDYLVGLKIDSQKSNVHWNSSSLPTDGIWPLGFTFKDYVDFIWQYSINTLGDKEDELRVYVDDSIYGPKVKQVPSGVTFVKDGYNQNCPVEIGIDAKAAIDTNYIAGLTSGTLRNVSVAIGARADATNPANKNTAQAIAIGYCARAAGGQSIAIGPGAKHLSGVAAESDETGNNAYAAGGTSIAIGYSTKAYGDKSIAIGSGNGGMVIASNDLSIAIGNGAVSAAKGAVQIGSGTNTSPNSLQFMGVKIVENGRLVGGSADPKEAVISSDVISASGGEISINLEPGSVSTILPETNCGPGTEIAVEAPVGGLRNYEVYLPNEPEICAGLPAGFILDELPEGIKKVIVNGKWQAHKLPAKIKVTQPYSRLVIGEITEMDDGTDWSPIITDAHVVWNSGKFATDGNKLLEGTNLHSGVSLKIAYPLSNTITCTNTIWGASDINDQGILDGTFYNYVISAEYTPKSGENLHSLDNDGNTWVEFIYETKCGKTPAVFRKQFNMYGP